MVAAALHTPSESARAHVAQLAEHFLGKEEVSGSSPDVGSTLIGWPAVSVVGQEA
jgi:hypothetical protein